MAESLKMSKLQRAVLLHVLAVNVKLRGRTIYDWQIFAQSSRLDWVRRAMCALNLEEEMSSR